MAVSPAKGMTTVTKATVTAGWPRVHRWKYIHLLAAVAVAAVVQ